jgi:HD-like signal output (HDOD) protein
VGGLLLARWSLPETISNCVTGHHDPDVVAEEYVGACRLVRAAEALCTSLGAGLKADGPADVDPFSILAELGMPDSKIEALLSEIEEVGVSVRGILPT